MTPSAMADHSGWRWRRITIRNRQSATISGNNSTLREPQDQQDHRVQGGHQEGRVLKAHSEGRVRKARKGSRGRKVLRGRYCQTWLTPTLRTRSPLVRQ